MGPTDGGARAGGAREVPLPVQVAQRWCPGKGKWMGNVAWSHLRVSGPEVSGQ